MVEMKERYNLNRNSNKVINDTQLIQMHS